jgi:hypothetical protein
VFLQTEKDTRSDSSDETLSSSSSNEVKSAASNGLGARSKDD